MKDRISVLIPGDELDVNAIARGFQEMTSYAKRDAGVEECILLVPSKASLQGTSLSSILGEKILRVLAKGGDFSLGDIRFRLETTRSLKRYSTGDAALVIYADQVMMDAIDCIPTLRIVVAVPHAPGAIDQWSLAWSPQTPGEEREAKIIVNDAVVEAALVSLTGRVNLANRILNPRDKEATVDAFLILRANGHFEDGANIRAWCMKNQWDPKGADEVRKYADRAFSLKSKPGTYGIHWAKDIYSKWKAASSARKE